MRTAPPGIRVAFEALSRGWAGNERPWTWEIVERAHRAILGVTVDAFRILAIGTGPEALAEVDRNASFWYNSPTAWGAKTAHRKRASTPRRTRRALPGEREHGADVVSLVRRLDFLGYRGDDNFE